MKLYLARRRNGLYQLSGLQPIVATIAGTSMTDVFVQPGDPVTLHGLCPFSVKTLFGQELELGEIRRVRVVAETIPSKLERSSRKQHQAATTASPRLLGHPELSQGADSAAA